MSVKLYIILLVLVLKLSIVLSGPALKSNYIEQENSCREVCGLCDCDGFYCEDECICECSIKDEDNLQCIADMKTECDKNGLEYELLMQDTTKERFLRQIRPNIMPFEKLSKNLVIIKKKREDVHETENKEDEVKQEEDHEVAAPVPSQPSGFLSNFNLPTLPPLPNRKIELPNFDNFEPTKLMMTIRERLSTTSTIPPPPPPTHRTFSVPLLSFTSPSPISFPPINIPSLPSSIQWENKPTISQPVGTW